MADTVIFVSGAYHLGNNPGIFQSAPFVGLSLVFPATLTWKPTEVEVGFVIHTHDVESWGGRGGHALTVNGTKLGEIKDCKNAAHPNEVTTILVPRTALEAALGGSDFFRLGIDVNVGSAPSLADDFVLTRIETQAFAARLGA
jgi:hypothetical protein